ncbi:MAG TPA: SRPBCC family protein [Burkholderiales bacterium]|nr:SRPBCC family protein [Burkholderiales bacterium]
MTFTQECVVPAARERLWDLLMDVPAVSRCVPGVGTVEAVGNNAYRGGIAVKVGPVRLSLEGTITVEEQDRTGWSARMRAEANDRRLGGGIRARMHLTLTPAEAGTHIRIDTDLAVLGKIGEFGQPIIKSKADSILAEFARNLGAALAV